MAFQPHWWCLGDQYTLHVYLASPQLVWPGRSWHCQVLPPPMSVMIGQHLYVQARRQNKRVSYYLQGIYFGLFFKVMMFKVLTGISKLQVILNSTNKYIGSKTLLITDFLKQPKINRINSVTQFSKGNVKGIQVTGIQDIFKVHADSVIPWHLMQYLSWETKNTQVISS